MTDPSHVRSAVPALPVSDERRAVTFYGEVLGFRELTDDVGLGPSFASRSNSTSGWRTARAGALSQPLAGSAWCPIEVTKIEPLDALGHVRGVVHPRAALPHTPWGTREFGVVDADGNLVTLFQREGA